MTSGPSFRLAQEADADLILEFMREYYAFDGHHYDHENSAAALMGLLRADWFGCIWLIQDGDAAVGYVVLTLGYSFELLGRDAFIDEFYLRETYRGRGWGTSGYSIRGRCRALPGRQLHSLGSHSPERNRSPDLSQAGLRGSSASLDDKADRTRTIQAHPAGAHFELTVVQSLALARSETRGLLGSSRFCYAFFRFCFGILPNSPHKYL